MWEVLKGGGYYITVPMTTICGPSQQPVDSFCCGTRPHNIRWWARTIALVIHVANTLRWTHSHDETFWHPYNSRHDMHFGSDMTCGAKGRCIIKSNSGRVFHGLSSAAGCGLRAFWRALMSWQSVGVRGCLQQRGRARRRCSHARGVM